MTDQKFKFSKAYPSDHLRCADLEGKQVTLTIKSWEYPDAKKDKGGDGKTMEGTVLLFAETPKRFVANVTNYRSIADLYGANPDKWAGKKITMKPAKTKFGRQMMDCIRIANIDPETGRAPEAF